MTVPPNIKQLLATRIDSFEKLELVVALHGAPRHTLSVEALCRALNLSKDVIRRAAMELRGAALVDLTSTGQVQLAPPTDRDSADVAELVRLYNEDRLLIVKALGEIAIERIRNMASNAFADAFVFRKKRKDDDG